MNLDLKWVKMVDVGWGWKWMWRGKGLYIGDGVRECGWMGWFGGRTVLSLWAVTSGTCVNGYGVIVAFAPC